MRRPALALIVTTVTLAACTAPTGTPQETPGAAPATSADASPSPTPTIEVPASVQCLESGTWVLDGARDAQLFAEGLGTHATAVSVEHGGEATWTFADGVLTRTYVGSTLTFTATMAVGEVARVTETTTLDGTTTAAYEATETDLVTQPADVTGLTIDVQATKNDAPVTFDDPGSSVREAEAMARTWGFTCEGDALLVGGRGPDGAVSQTAGSYAFTRR